MKKILLAAIAALSLNSFVVKAQNTFPSSGNVGIGTTSPSATLQIDGSMGSVDSRNFKLTYPGGGSLTNTELSGLSHLSSELGLGWTALYAKQGSASYAAVFNGITYFANGKVGIGTSTPDELLSVNGTIHSKEVKVNLTGLPDYVFKADYKLPTLAEVKSYVDKNSHLPEMPSAQEVEKNGLNLGEMNKLLLKKVEELTLYLIEQKQEIDKLKSEVKILNDK